MHKLILNSEMENQRCNRMMMKVLVSISTLFFIFLFSSISLVSSLPSTSMPSPINLTEVSLQRTLLTQEADYNGDGITDVYTNFTKINSTVIEINVHQTNPNTKGGNAYKWASAICNKSLMPNLKYLQEDAQGGFNNAFPISLTYGKLVNYGLPATWCSANGGNGYVLFGGGSGDKNYRLIIPQGKNFDIMTGKGSEQVKYEWLNNTFTIYPTSDYQRDAFTIKIYDCSGNQLTYPNIAWMESNVSTDNKIVFYPYVGTVNLSCIRFRTNTLETPHFTTTSQFFTSTTPYYQLSFEDFESKNNITSRNITVVHPTFIESFFDVFPFVWRVFSYQADTTYYDIEYKGTIVDLDPSLALTYTSSSDLLYANKTEGTTLGARLTASVLSMDFNTPAENIINLGYQNGSLYQSGTYVKDGSVYNNYGTSTGLTKQFWWNGNTEGTGKINGSLQFDGVNDYINIADNSALSFSNFTLSGWLKPYSATGTTALISKSASALVGEYTFFYDPANSLVRCRVVDDAADAWMERNFASSQIPLNSWTYLACTYNGNGSASGIKIYVNGTELTSAGITTTGTFNSMQDTTQAVTIGARGASYFNGSIDDVIIWGRALNATEINTTYQEGLAGRTIGTPVEVKDWIFPSDGLVSYFGFNNDTAAGDNSTKVVDYVGGNNLTCASGTCFTLANSSVNGTYPTLSGNLQESISGTYNFGTGNYAISFWIYGVSQGLNGGLMQNYNASNCGFSIGGYTGHTDFAQGCGGATNLWYQPASALTNWNYLVWTRNSTGTYLYVNGRVVSSYTGTVINVSSINAQFKLTSTQAIGKLDELRIYNRSLSASEVQDSFSSQRAHYKLDELSGTSAIDIGGGNTGTLTNYPTTATTAPVWNATGGVDGSGAYVFDGVNDRIVTPLISSVNSGMTISLNMKANNVSNGPILLNWGSYIFCAVGRLTTNKVNCVVDGSSAASAVSTTSVNDSQWHSVVYVILPNNTQRLYLDGNLEGSATETLTTQSASVLLGIYADLASYPFNGSIDNVQIFNRALSASEILELYNGTYANKTIKYSTKQGDFTSGVFYNTTQTYWNISLATADTTSRSGIVNADNSINLSNPNLVSYWALDGNYLDARGVSNGTCTSCPNNASGISSSAMRFDGSSQYVNISNVSTQIWNGSRGMNNSAFVWIKEPSHAGRKTIVLAGYSATNYPGWILNSNANYLEMYVSDAYITSTTNSIGDNNWHHVGYVKLFNNTVTIYVDGNPVKSGSLTRDPVVSAYELYIGAVSSSAQFFNGSIDELVYYNKSLSASEIQQIYKSGLSQHANTNVTIQTRTANNYNVSDSSLVAFWALNNDSSIGENSTKFVDLKNGLNNGTCSGTTCPVINSSSGVVWNGAYFDGSNDGISVPYSSNLNFNNTNFTISMWFNTRSWADDRNFISRQVAGGSGSTDYSFVGNAVGSISFYIGASNSVATQTGISTNKWHHIIATYNPTTKAIYLDGILQSSAAAGAKSNIAPATLYIGGGAPGTGTVPGLIDEVRIYNRSLSAAEVMNLYQLGSYHISDWTPWTNQSVVNDGTPLTTSASGKFMQFKTYLNSNDTQVSPYVNSYNVTSAEAPVPADLNYPVFSNQLNNYPNQSLYVYNRNYNFNITIDSTNGTAGIEFNGVNYSINNISSVFTYSNNTLNAGNYNYYYWAYGNGTLNLFNSSQVYSYTINKTTLAGAILGLGTFTYPKATSVSYTESNDGDTDVIYNWYRNSLAVSNPDADTLGVNTYTYLLNSSGGINYNQNDSIATGNLVINQNTTYNLSLTASPSWYGSIGDTVTVTGTGCPSEISCMLYRDGIEKLNPNINQYFNGTYVWVYNSSGNENYSAQSFTDTLYINYTNGGTTTVTTNQTLIYGEDAPYVILSYGVKFNNGGFVYKGHGIQFNN